MPENRIRTRETMRKTLPLDATPGVSQLYRDYVGGVESAVGLFPQSPWDSSAFGALAGKLEKRDYERSALASTLLEQNEQYGADEAALEKCRRLERDDAVAVLTGQQTGFLGGPLYSVVKALHAVKLAQHLEQRLQRPVVPIFWMELEDHDLAEVDRVTVRGRDDQLQTVRIPMETVGAVPVNRIAIGTGLKAALEQLSKIWRATEFSDELFALIERCYSPEKTLADGFAMFMSALLSRFGLILADPSHPFFKRRASGVFSTEIESPLTSTKEFAQQAERIEAAHYHRQVRADADRLSLYLLDNGEKLRIIRQGDYFALENPAEVISGHDLQAVARSEPQRLIPSALLRPIVQDTLFPTLVYVGGPSEVAYFAQLPPAYALHGVPMPVIKPRAGVSLFSGAERRTIRQYNIEAQEIFQPVDALLEHILKQHMPEQAEQCFKWTQEEINGALGRLRTELGEDDGSFGRLVDGAREKISYHVDKLRDRYLKELESRHETVVRRIGRLAAVLYPEQKPQERVYCIAEIINQWGPVALDYIHDAIEIEPPVHTFVEI